MWTGTATDYRDVPAPCYYCIILGANRDEKTGAVEYRCELRDYFPEVKECRAWVMQHA